MGQSHRTGHAETDLGIERQGQGVHQAEPGTFVGVARPEDAYLMPAATEGFHPPAQCASYSIDFR